MLFLCTPEARCGLFEDFGGEDFDVVDGTVVGVGGGFLDLFDNIHALEDATKDGVGAVEMGCASDGGVVLADLGGEVCGVSSCEALGLFVESILE